MDRILQSYATIDRQNFLMGFCIFSALVVQVPFNCIAHFKPPAIPAGQHGVNHVRFEMDGVLKYLLIMFIDQMC